MPMPGILKIIQIFKKINKSKPSASQTRTIPAAQEGETEQTIVPGQVRAEQQGIIQATQAQVCTKSAAHQAQLSGHRALADERLRTQE